MGLHLKNYMEIIVENSMDNVLKDYAGCRCDKCRMDIMAIALNKLTPHYVVSEKGSLFAKVDSLEFQFMADVTSEIISAAEFVQKHPRHI
jgi:competence protein ComFB